MRPFGWAAASATSYAVSPEGFRHRHLGTAGRGAGPLPRTAPVGARFGVVIVIENGRPYEVATFRTESDYDDGRHPSRVAFATAEEDVRRRDFTVNGLLMDPETGRIIDYVEGRRDIERRLIRTIGKPTRACRGPPADAPGRPVCGRARLHNRRGDVRGN